MNSETRCNGFQYLEIPNILIPHYCYSGDLPIEIIVSDLNQLISCGQRTRWLPISSLLRKL